MALLLNIPPNKTLLRRHLATNFNLLIGSEAHQLKQECLENPDYTLLTATTKVKVKHEFPWTDRPFLLQVLQLLLGVLTKKICWKCFFLHILFKWVTS